MSKRRLYTKEFKKETTQLVESQEGNASKVARHLCIKPNLRIPGQNCHPFRVKCAICIDYLIEKARHEQGGSFKTE